MVQCRGVTGHGACHASTWTENEDTSRLSVIAKR
jgi:hypothetical protein